MFNEERKEGKKVIQGSIRCKYVGLWDIWEIRFWQILISYAPVK